MGWILAHGGRITWDEMALIAALVVPLFLLIVPVLQRALRGSGARGSSQGEERGRG